MQLANSSMMASTRCWNHSTHGAVDDETGKFSSDPKLTFQHPYPPTKIMFMPDKEGAQPDLLATTGDYLRIWKVEEDGVQLHKLLNNVRLRPSVSNCMNKSTTSGVINDAR